MQITDSTEGHLGVEDDGRIVVRGGFCPQAWRRAMAADVREGLGRTPFTLPPRYLYDARGSRLFEAITRLSEYYPTRTERAILRRAAAALLSSTEPSALVELGAGSAGKTEVLLSEGVRQNVLRRYAALDVSPAAVRGAIRRLADLYPTLELIGIVDDFESGGALPCEGERRLVLFLGSTIGNLAPPDAVAFVRSIRQRIGPADGFLVGFDLVKDPSRLVGAYDDAQGVTAAFNKNVLRVLNTHLDADFDTEQFEHRALWNESAARIEMHLVARRRQVVRIGSLDMCVELARGESICTELSHKYTRSTATDLLERGGFQVVRWDTDPEHLFAVALARPA